MLEDPTYDKIVRWGEGGQSFVVLEVRCAWTVRDPSLTTTEREVYQVRSTKALQAL